MGQFHQLLKVFTPQQLHIVGKLRLIGKEKKVFDFFYSRIQDIDLVIVNATTACGVSETHLYKISSLLIRKCLDALFDVRKYESLIFLKNNHLFVLLKHEMKHMEKILDKTEKEKFYLKCFHLLIDVPFKFYDKAEIHKYAQKYLLAKSDRTKSDDLYVYYHQLFAHLNIVAAGKNPLRHAPVSYESLKKDEIEIENSDHHLAKYYLYRTFCSWHTYYQKDDKMVLHYLEKAMELKSKINYFFEIDIAVFLDLLYADALFKHGNEEEAFVKYQKIFNKGLSTEMYGYYYHCEQYVLLLLLKNKYGTAKEILNNVFEPIIKLNNDIYATRGALSFAKYYLLTNDFRSALQHISIASEINEKSFYLPFEIQIRVLENCCFVLKGDTEFAAQLAQRNIKYLNTQKDKTIIADYISFFKILVTVLVKPNKILTEKQQKDFYRIEKQYRSLYADILKRVMSN